MRADPSVGTVSRGIFFAECFEDGALLSRVGTAPAQIFPLFFSHIPEEELKLNLDQFLVGEVWRKAEIMQFQGIEVLEWARCAFWRKVQGVVCPDVRSFGFSGFFSCAGSGHFFGCDEYFKGPRLCLFPFGVEVDGGAGGDDNANCDAKSCSVHHVSP